MISWPGQKDATVTRLPLPVQQSHCILLYTRDSCPAQCLLRNQISRSLFSSLEEVWLYFYPMVGRNTGHCMTWREIKSLPRCLFSSLNIYRGGQIVLISDHHLLGWEKKQTGGVMTRGWWPPQISVMLPLGALWSCQDDTDVPDTDIKMPPIPKTLTRPALTPWLASGWEEGPRGQKIWKNKRNQPQQSGISSTKELLWDF